MNNVARRKGHTLLELMAVIAILVVVAAVGVPLLKPMLAQRNDSAAADVVRARLSRLQSKAVSDGRAYCFQYQKNTKKFRCIVDVDEGMDDEDHWEETGDLPNDVTFPENVDKGVEQSSSDGWVKVASFLPDNTCHRYLETLTFGKDVVNVHGTTKVEKNQ